MKSYLLNHIQGFQKCKNYQNISTGRGWINSQKSILIFQCNMLLISKVVHLLIKVFSCWSDTNKHCMENIPFCNNYKQKKFFETLGCLIKASDFFQTFDCLLAIVNMLLSSPNFFGMIINQMQSEFVVFFSNFPVWDIRAMAWDALQDLVLLLWNRR